MVSIAVLMAVTSCKPAVDDNIAETSSSGSPGSVSTSDIKDGSITPAKLSQAYLPLAGGSMSGAISLSGNPTSALHAAPKQYVDAYLGGMAIGSLSALSNGQALSWNASLLQWEPASVNLSGAIIGQITFSTTNITLKAGFQTVVNATPVLLTANTNVAWSGAAGWRYIVLDSAGAATIETIPGAEITADTSRYTPAPTFNSTLNGYYSSVNTTKRIVGIARGDGTNFLEVIPYGHGRRKNDDDFFMYTISGYGGNTMRWSTIQKTRGTSVTYADDGTNGTTFTANVPGTFLYQFNCVAGGGVNNTLYVKLNGTNDSSYEDAVLGMGFINNGNHGLVSGSVHAVQGDILRPILSNAGAGCHTGDAHYNRARVQFIPD